MVYLQTVNATEVRNNFSYYIDTVVREKPIAVKRNRDVLLFLSDRMVKDLLHDLTIRAELTKEDDIIVGEARTINDIFPLLPVRLSYLCCCGSYAGNERGRCLYRTATTKHLTTGRIVIGNESWIIRG